MKYLKSLLRHKWFVFLEACKLGIPFLGLIHDISKFLPDEFIPYSRYDFTKFGKNESGIQLEFDKAWLKHQKRNKHHWQYWLLLNDSGDVIRHKKLPYAVNYFEGEFKQVEALPMPDRYIREMVADWRGAGRAYGNPDTKAWFIINKDKIILHPKTEVGVWGLLYK
jgi:hypothetical protein